MKAMMTTIMLLFMLHVAPTCSLPPTMAARDKSALTAVSGGIENKEDFPEIKCYSGSWSPFKCDKSGRVTEIDLYFLKLRGRIAVEIGNLTKLTDLDLSYNKLSGSIPSSIGNLKSLQSLNLLGNQLSGSIPSSIKNLTFLFSFDISNNYFTGPIVQVNSLPYCSKLSANCLFGSNLPNGCKAISQRSKSTCLSFCNATQVGGPCGGKGVCSISSVDGKTRTCACNQGFNNLATKYTCK